MITCLLDPFLNLPLYIRDINGTTPFNSNKGLIDKECQNVGTRPLVKRTI
jgi:hypothetical protein